jgi:hypothetical protein
VVEAAPEEAAEVLVVEVGHTVVVVATAVAVVASLPGEAPTVADTAAAVEALATVHTKLRSLEGLCRPRSLGELRVATLCFGWEKTETSQESTKSISKGLYNIVVCRMMETSRPAART